MSGGGPPFMPFMPFMLFISPGEGSPCIRGARMMGAPCGVGDLIAVIPAIVGVIMRGSVLGKEQGREAKNVIG